MADPKYKPKLTEDRLDKLNQAVDKLEEAIGEGMVDVPNKPVEQLPVFDIDAVQNAMDKLTKVHNDIFNAIEKEIEKDNQIPETPVNPPNGEGEGNPDDNGNGNNG